ncbi:MAG: dihydropteroate synthase [Tepidisphaera sp.]|nr:dihydropteroate synthase [Tepidisphaera sp.]
MHAWRLSSRVSLPLDAPRVMGVLNVTPDSFFDGGRHASPAQAAAAAWRMVDEGAALLDIGGESTRPGATSVSEVEQIRRVVPVIRAIRALPAPTARDIPITIDTTRAEVAQAALDAGADAINDVSGGTDDPAMLSFAASRDAGIILMHRVAPPRHDQYSDRYQTPPLHGDASHIVDQVASALAALAARAISAGLKPANIMLDPGLGFGKTVEQNLALVRGTKRLAALGYPILSAASRKSFVGRVSLGRDSAPAERLPGSIAFSLAHLLYGCRVFRVHDVAEHARALAAAWRLLPDSPPES